jgi:glycosyltransferase involved in cell wall biosynthesis
MQKLKLCLVSLALFPDHKDGSAKFARGLYDTLKDRGHDVTFLTAKWDKGFNDPNIITLDVPHSRFLWVPKFIFKFRKYLKNNDFDIIHGIGSRGSLPIMYSGKPFITTIHDLGPFEANFTKIPVVRWIEKKNAKQSSHIVVISEFTKNGVVKYMKVPREKITNIFLGIDPKFEPKPKEAAILKEKLGIKGPILYYLGRIAFYKGVDHIIEAYYKAKKEIPDLNLVIGGKATLKMADTFEKWKKEYSDVKFVGLVPDEDMATYYSMADAFITYSYASEGFGITPIESLACKTPVICSSMPAYQEVLEDCAFFVEPQSPNLLANQIIELFKHPELGEEMVKKSTILLKKYTWSSVCDTLESVYENYLQNFPKN